VSGERELDPGVVRDELNRRALERKGVHKVLSSRFSPETNERFDQEIQALLETHFGTRRFAEVLEIGTGIGRLAHFFHRNAARYVGVDYSREMFAHASYMLRELPNVELFFGDATSSEFDFPKAAFELGIMSLVLKHNNDARARELASRLKVWCREVLLVEHVEGGASGSEIAVIRPEAWYLEVFAPLKPKVIHRFRRHEDQMIFAHLVP
jgi:SAM-dependent methyltransferase